MAYTNIALQNIKSLKLLVRLDIKILHMFACTITITIPKRKTKQKNYDTGKERCKSHLLIY